MNNNEDAGDEILVTAPHQFRKRWVEMQAGVISLGAIGGSVAVCLARRTDRELIGLEGL